MSTYIFLVLVALAALAYFIRSGKLYFSRRVIGSIARDVRFDMLLRKDNETGLPELLVAAPFYDERKGRSTGLSRRGLYLGYTATRTMQQVIAQSFNNNCLLQVVLDGAARPSREELQERGLKPFEQGIADHKGILVHTPQSMANGSLDSYLTLGTDIFIIYPSDRTPSSGQLDKLADAIETGSVRSAIRAVGGSGALLKLNEVWRVCHRDTEQLRAFARNFTNAAIAKLFRLNELDSHGVDFAELRLPMLDRLFTEYDSELRGTLYFEDDCAVAHWREPRTGYGSATVTVPALRRRNAHLKPSTQLRRWLLPELVVDRAYRRHSLLRFFIQYLLLTGYVVGLAVLITVAAEPVGGVLSERIVGIVLAACWISGSCALVLSLSYLGRAIFGGRRLLQRD